MTTLADSKTLRKLFGKFSYLEIGKVYGIYDKLAVYYSISIVFYSLYNYYSYIEPPYEKIHKTDC